MRKAIGVINRRVFLVIVAGITSSTSAAKAQPRVTPRIGILLTGPSNDLRVYFDEFRHELGKLGWIDRQTVTVLDIRSAEGRNERLPGLVAEVLDANPQIVVVHGAPGTRALQQSTKTTAIVMWAVGDPVEYGLVASLTNPGGNITGTSYLVNEVAGKLVELLREAAPAVRSVALLLNPGNPGSNPYLRIVQATAHTLGIRVHALEVRAAEDFDLAFTAIVKERTGAIILLPEPLVRSQRSRVADFAARQRLTLILHGPPAMLGPGMLLSYAATARDYPRLVASYVDRILRGAKPSDLPIHQPTEFELALNLKTAGALGLTIPPSLLLRADQVIE